VYESLCPSVYGALLWCACTMQVRDAHGANALLRQWLPSWSHADLAGVVLTRKE
jgi:hypothetical protein